MSKTLGMIIGRFQHLHIGHVEMIKQGIERCDQILLLVGSSQESSTVRNPFPCSLRIEVIEAVFKKEIQERRLFVGDIQDLTNEDDHSLAWGDYVFEVIEDWKGQYGIVADLGYMVYGNDEERQTWYRNEHVDDVKQLVLDRGTLPISATKMREFLIQDDRVAWLSYMPADRLSFKEMNRLYDLLREELIKVPEYQRK